jgi:3-carboxy-cis,cis-muconate cycloisomerase
LGGPVGALEALGKCAGAVRHRMAMRLGLADVRAWHVHRNAWIDLLGRMAQATLTAGKIARDVSLLSQPEVGEMLEAVPRDGVGMSSAMPHKRNPVACVHALAAAIRMPGLIASLHAAALADHERALGGWQAELALVPEIAGTLGTSLDFLDTIAASLVVNAERMKANLAQYGEPAGDPAALEAAADELLADLAPYLS